MTKQEVAESIVLLKNDEKFKALISVLLDYRQDYFNQFISVPRTRPDFTVEVAWQQGRVAGLDTIYKILDDASRVVKQSELRREHEEIKKAI